MLALSDLAAHVFNTYKNMIYFHSYFSIVFLKSPYARYVKVKKPSDFRIHASYDSRNHWKKCSELDKKSITLLILYLLSLSLFFITKN